MQFKIYKVTRFLLLFTLCANILLSNAFGKQQQGNIWVDRDVQHFPEVAINNAAAFQLISHGRPGNLLLDGKWRNAPDIVNYIKQHRLLSADIKQLNIYGCEFGKGKIGVDAVAYIEKNLGLNVAASSNITGKNGDWILEVGKPRFVLSENKYNDNLQVDTSDADGDGVPNWRDIDDDNDGVTDVNESTCTSAVYPNKSSIVITTQMTYNFNGTPTLQRLLDGIDGGIGNNTYVISAPTGSITNTWLQFAMPAPTILTFIELSNYPSQTLFSNSSVYIMQGSVDNVNWVTITPNQTATPAPSLYGTNNSVFFSMTNNTIAFLYYRIKGVSGGAGNGWAQEAYFQATTCTDINTDNDALVNRFDPDSDNDGCSDAIESGATNNAAANYQFPAPVGANGLADTLEAVVDNGTTKYISSYQQFALDNTTKACLDSDGDGLRDVFDIDDDNDGVLDELESTCTQSQMPNKSGVIVSTQINYTFNGTPTLQRLVDGIDGGGGNNTYVISSPSGTLANTTWLQFQLPKITVLKSIELGHFPGQTLFSQTSVYNIQASNDSVNWTTLVYNQIYSISVGIYATNNSVKFSMPKNTQAFRFYRIRGVSGAAGTGAAQELYFQESLCTDNNTDGDALVDRLDLDTDGDGCSDALESGATTNTLANYQFTGAIGRNGLDNSLETVSDNGSTTYSLTYLAYAIDSTVNACFDSDNDGIRDVFDLDDDNDGILDMHESNCSYNNGVDKSRVVVTTQMSYTYNGSRSLQRLVDGVDGGPSNNNYVISAPSGTITNTWLEFEMPNAMPLKMIEIGDLNGTPLFTTSSVYNLQASNDDTTWTTIAANQTYTNSAPIYANNTSAKISMVNNNANYRFYRLQGVSGGSGGGWAQEVYFMQFTCTDNNSDDDDALVNRLDLDSDNDGCSDALEGGATNNTSIPNYVFTGNVGTNGFDNSLETVADNGNINYPLTFLQYAVDSTINACINSDNDNILDVNDIDDDNDGILDIQESNCSYKLLKNKSSVIVSTQMTYSFNGTPSLQRLVDGVDDRNPNTTYVISAPTGDFVNTTWLEFELPVASVLRLIELSHVQNQRLFAVGSTYSIQGSNDNLNWTTIEASQSYVNTPRIYATNNSAKFSMPNNLTIYRFYRILGISGSAQPGGGWAQEAYFQTYTCTDINTDEDLQVNRIDLDSDNDGCSDAQEGGATSNTSTNYQFTGNVGTNGLDNSLETAPDNGNTNYTLTYQKFARDSTAKACMNSDNDPLFDVYDIDDDNDGITDAVESDCSYKQLRKKGILVTSELSYTYFGLPQSLQRLVDGIDGNVGNTTYVISAPTGPIIKTWLQFELPNATALKLIELGHYDNQYLFSLSSQYAIEGSNDNQTWTTIVDTQTYTNTPRIYAKNNSAKFSMPNNTDLYRFYRIIGISGGAGFGWAQEAYFQVYNCTDLFTDADGTANRIDLDADNDGCSDAFEGGSTTNTAVNYQFTGTMGTNGLDNSLETTPDNGNTNYTQTYLQFAADSTIKACTDTDGDGIYDVYDADDDNDGVTDLRETNCTYSLLPNKSDIVVSSEITYSFHGAPQTLQRLVDGIDGDLGSQDYVIGAPSGTLTNTAWLKFELPSAAALNLIELGHYATQSLFATSSTYRLEGSNDNVNWKTIVSSQNYSNTPPVYATNNSAKFNMPYNTIAYRYYRVEGINGVPQPGGGWAQEAYFRISTCTDINTDGDALVDRLDPDSDNDGCSDALEGGATTNTATNYQFTGNVGTNGLDNSLETAPDNGNTNYTLIYADYALDSTIRACLNSDNDTLLDINDIDDDNDGITDEKESKCYYKLYDDKSNINVTSQMTYQFNGSPPTLQRLVDGIDGDVGNTSYVISAPSGDSARTWLQFELPTAVTLRLIELGHYDGQRLFASGSTYNIDGSNDGVSWTTLAANQFYNNTAALYATNNSAKFAMPNNKSIYRFYRIQGISGSAQPGGGWAQEAYFQQYTCSDINTDGDAQVNRVDLDSDNDGCSDALEGGATTNTATNYQFTGSSVGANGLANALETTPDNGNINYPLTYQQYALDSTLRACINSDNDTLLDVNDIDDDNDGVPDVNESKCTYKLIGNKSAINVTSEMTYLFHGSPQSLQRLVDGIDGDVGNRTYVISQPTGQIARTWLEFELPSAVSLKLIELGHYDGQRLFSPSSLYSIQGSNDNLNWDTIVASQSYINTAPIYATNNSAKFMMPNNNKIYRFYRLRGISGGMDAGLGWAQEAYFQTYNCTDINTDGDGQANRIDLDSDNDGCSDAFESGASTNYATNYQFSGNVGTNGLDNSLETGPDNGIVNYVSTYLPYAANSGVQSCFNSDNDTIPDIRDIDDDNDGVLDIVEANCSNKLMANKSSVIVTTQLPYMFNGAATLQRLVDGVDGGPGNTSYVCRPPDSFTISNVWFNFELPQPQPLNMIEMSHYPGQTLFSTNSVYNVEGSMDNYNWTTIISNQVAQPIPSIYGTNNSVVANMPNNFTYYQFYRIKGVSGARGSGWGQEVYFQQYNCLDFDSDNDNVANRIDFDSDNDGCTDAQESGVTSKPGVTTESNNAIISGPYSVNGFAKSIQSPSDSNSYNYTYSYPDAENPGITTVCDQLALPLALITFEANEYQGTKGLIKWQALNEIAGLRYVLEKSTDAKNFKYLYAVNGKANTAQNNYSFIDPNLEEGQNFYRLKMISSNNIVSYSDVVSINHATRQSLAELHPNPTDGNITFEFLSDGSSNEISLWVDNIVGQRVHSKQIFKIVKGKNQIKMNLTELSQGVYLFNYKAGDNNFGTIKFTKK